MSPANGDIWPDIELQMPVDSGRATLSNPNRTRTRKSWVVAELSCLPCRGH